MYGHKIAFPSHTLSNYFNMQDSSTLAVKLLIEICDRRSKNKRIFPSEESDKPKEKVPKCGNRVLKTTSL